MMIGTMLRLHAIPYSTNVERVLLALGVKGREVEVVLHDAADRTAVREVSGQDLVPVLEHADGVLVDSMGIVEWIERSWPDPPLVPGGTAASREVRGFVTWFDDVWKVAPNGIEAQLLDSRPDPVAIARLEARMRASRHDFEALLLGRDFLFGDEPGLADVCSYPFLRYARDLDPFDDELFHRILAANLDLEGAFPRLTAWIARMAALPRPT
jgi:maleylpyruvate isomerase